MTSSVKREAYGFKGALLIIHCKRNPKQGHFVVHNSCTVLGVGGFGLFSWWEVGLVFNVGPILSKSKNIYIFKKNWIWNYFFNGFLIIKSEKKLIKKSLDYFFKFGLQCVIINFYYYKMWVGAVHKSLFTIH